MCASIGELAVSGNSTLNSSTNLLLLLWLHQCHQSLDRCDSIFGGKDFLKCSSIWSSDMSIIFF